MKIILFFYSVVLFTSATLFAQAPDTMWTRTYGGNDFDGGYSVKQTSDGGYIITGDTYSYAVGEGDVWLIKTKSNGDTLWTKSFGGTNGGGYIGGPGGDRGRSVQETKDGGYIIAGTYNSIGAAGEFDFWLIKTDEIGDTLWTKIYGGDNTEVAKSVQQTEDNGYIITGYTDSFGAGDSDVWLVKTNSTGDTLWTRTFGGSRSDGGSSVQQTTDGGYIITGYTESFGAGDHDIWLIKTDSIGGTLWTKTFGGNRIDEGNSVKQTNDGGFIVTGFVNAFAARGTMDMFVAKINADGIEEWAKTYGGNSFDEGNSIIQTTDGGYVIVGHTSSFGAGGSDIWLIKIDTEGDTFWTKTFGGDSDDYGNSIEKAADGGYIIAGSFERDVWLIKLAPDITSGINSPNVLPAFFSLHQNYPNPFNPSTTIEFSLAQSGFVTLKVYNLLGEEVATMLETHKPAGRHTVSFVASALASGLYYYTLTTDNFKQTRKMLLMR